MFFHSLFTPYGDKRVKGRKENSFLNLFFMLREKKSKHFYEPSGDFHFWEVRPTCHKWFDSVESESNKSFGSDFQIHFNKKKSKELWPQWLNECIIRTTFAIFVFFSSKCGKRWYIKYKFIINSIWNFEVDDI